MILERKFQFFNILLLINMEDIYTYIFPLYLNEKLQLKILINDKINKEYQNNKAINFAGRDDYYDIYNILDHYPSVYSLKKIIKNMPTNVVNAFIRKYDTIYNIKDILQYGIMIDDFNMIIYVLSKYLIKYLKQYGLGKKRNSYSNMLYVEPIEKRLLLENNLKNIEIVDN